MALSSLWVQHKPPKKGPVDKNSDGPTLFASVCGTVTVLKLTWIDVYWNVSSNFAIELLIKFNTGFCRRVGIAKYGPDPHLGVQPTTTDTPA